MWNNMKLMREGTSMEDDFSEDALERAYNRGCRHGYEKGYREAMEDVSSSSSYGERRAWRIEEDDRSRERGGGWSGDDYGERRYHRTTDGRFR